MARAICHGLDRRRLWRFRQSIGQNREVSVRQVVVKSSIVALCDDGKAFRHRSPDSGRMIEMVMRIDHGSERLVCAKASRFLNYRESSLVALRSLDKEKMILHLDRDAVVRSSGEK